MSDVATNPKPEQASGPTNGYSLSALLACVASRLLENDRSVFVGTGLPMIAALLAQKSHAPRLLIVFEAGGVGPRVPVLPISVGDSRDFPSGYNGLEHARRHGCLFCRIY